MINYTECWEVWDDESAEIGETDDRGMEGAFSASFAEAVKLLQCTEPSASPLRKNDRQVWFTYYHEQDTSTGSYKVTSYHPSTDRDCRYMVKAWLSGNK